MRNISENILCVLEWCNACKMGHNATSRWVKLKADSGMLMNQLQGGSAILMNQPETESQKHKTDADWTIQRPYLKKTWWPQERPVSGSKRKAV